MFAQVLRRLLEERGWSQNDLARRASYHKGYVSKLINGKQRPSDDVARRCDQLLSARGELIGAAHLDIAAVRDTRPAYTSELLQRIKASDTSTVTLESLEATVTDLCCQYAQRDALELRSEGHDWLKEIARLLKAPVGLKEHQRLLVAAGWLALLIGCIEYDLGMRSSAEATRITAQQLGHEADAPDIIGWTHEMSAWFALTQGRYSDVVEVSETGLLIARERSVSAQLIGQKAKALGRLGDVQGVRQALEEGQQLLDRLGTPDRTDNHFTVDPAKWDFYAMDAYRQAADDKLASEHAREVIRNGIVGVHEISPMRVAEARLTLAVGAARKGELDSAVLLGKEALAGKRKSLPSLLMVASELDSELSTRFPSEDATHEFQDLLRMLR